jgi:hypothetical protein
MTAALLLSDTTLFIFGLLVALGLGFLVAAAIGSVVFGLAAIGVIVSTAGSATIRLVRGLFRADRPAGTGGSDAELEDFFAPKAPSSEDDALAA